MPSLSTPSSRPGGRLTRRRLLVASGAGLAAAAPAVLAACGTAEDDEGSPARDAEILNEVLAAQLAVLDGLGSATTGAPGSVEPSLARLERSRRESTTELERFIADAGGKPTAEAAQAEPTESSVEGVARRLEAAIAAAIEGIGEISDVEAREAVLGYVTEDAAALAAVRSVLGEEVAPDAFVFGAPVDEEQGESP